MSKIWSVARSEYVSAVRSKAFILGVIMLPILLGVSIGVQVLVKDKGDVRDRKFAVVDRTGTLYPVIAEAAEQRNERTIYDGEGDDRKQVRPRFLPERHAEVEGEQTELLLSERVREGDLFAFLVVGAGSVLEDPTPDSGLSYYSETPTYRDLSRWLEGVVNEEIRSRRLEEADISPALVNELTRRIPLSNLGLVEISESGEVERPEEVSELVTFGIPFACIFLLFTMVMSTAPTLLNNVLEEKMQKIAELLVSAVTPFQLMMGKLLGSVLVSLTLSLLYLLGLLYVAHTYDVLPLIPKSIIGWFLFFQVLALLIFGSVFSAIGAACTEMRDAQSLMFPAMLLVMLPLFCWAPVLEAPTSPFARAISLFPPATPMLMLMRIAIPPGPPLWEIGLAVVLTLLFTVVCVAAAAKIFRIGILSQGQAPTFRRLVGWIFAK